MPTVSLDSKILLTVSGVYTVADSTFGNTSKNIGRSIVDTLISGNATDQANRYYSVTATGSTGGDSYDLAGSLTDVFGNTLTFASVCGILIKNDSTTTGENLTVGNGTNPFLTWVGGGSHTITVKEDGIFFLWAPKTPYTVTASTGDVLKITAASGTPAYELLIIGRS